MLDFRTAVLCRFNHLNFLFPIKIFLIDRFMFCALVSVHKRVHKNINSFLQIGKFFNITTIPQLRDVDDEWNQ